MEQDAVLCLAAYAIKLIRYYCIDETRVPVCSPLVFAYLSKLFSKGRQHGHSECHYPEQ